MSYLQNEKANIPNFKECVISFWFRVPSESMAKIKYDGEADPAPVLNGILPLLVMGPEGMNEGRYDFNFSSALYLTTEFHGVSGMPDGWIATYPVYECTSTFTIHLVFDIECCGSATVTTVFTPTINGVPGEPGDKPEGTPVYNHTETYRATYAPVPHPDEPANPTCIGVTDDGYLYINFQTNQRPDITDDGGYRFPVSITPGSDIIYGGKPSYYSGTEVTTINYYHNALGCTGLAESSSHVSAYVEGESGSQTYTAPEVHEQSYPNLPVATASIESGGPSYGTGNNIKVTPDEWHHVLVSVKLQPTETHSMPRGSEEHGFVGGCLLYVALDDKHYEKEDLNSLWVEGDFKPNEVYPWDAWDVATDTYNSDTGGFQITYDLREPEIPAAELAIGIPATAKYTDNICKAEIAELQIWFGKSLDTGIESNRRAFIDNKPGEKAEDLIDPETGETVMEPNSGEPATDSRGRIMIDSDTGRPHTLPGTEKPKKDPRGMVPVAMSKAAALLKRKPDIILHGSKNWKLGKNTGVLANPRIVEDQETGEPKKLDGQFTRMGDIKTWKPDPVLGETEGAAVEEVKPQ